MSAAGGVVGAVATMLIAVMIARNNGLDGSALAMVLGIGGATSLIWLVGPLLRVLRSDIQVLGDAVFVRARPLGAARCAAIDEIKEVVTQESTLGRQLGYGTVALYGRGNTAAMVRHVKNPDGLRNAIESRRKVGRRRPRGAA